MEKQLQLLDAGGNTALLLAARLDDKAVVEAMARAGWELDVRNVSPTLGSVCLSVSLWCLCLSYQSVCLSVCPGCLSASQS